MSELELRALRMACEQLSACYPKIPVDHWAASVSLQARLRVGLEHESGLDNKSDFWVARGLGLEEDLDAAGDLPMDALTRWDAAYSHLRERVPEHAS